MCFGVLMAQDEWQDYCLSRLPSLVDRPNANNADASGDGDGKANGASPAKTNGKEDTNDAKGASDAAAADLHADPNANEVSARAAARLTRRPVPPRRRTVTRVADRE